MIGRRFFLGGFLGALALVICLVLDGGRLAGGYNLPALLRRKKGRT
jgi:hypothetical protein